MDISGLWPAVGIPVLRSVGGWATKALKDKKVEMFEWKKLAETVLRTGILGSLIYFGADGAGFELEPLAAAASAVILDMILGAWKENKNVTKR